MKLWKFLVSSLCSVFWPNHLDHPISCKMMIRVSRRVSRNVRGFQQLANYSEKSRCDVPQIAVVLAGCGRNDGSEVHGAVAILSHITRNEGLPHVFAPCMKQKEVVNHATFEEDKVSARNVLTETARIAPGKVKPLADLASSFKEYNSVIIAGGEGVMKNLSNFKYAGSDCTIIPDLVKILEGCHKAKIPLGFVGNSSYLAARAFCKVVVTVGKSCPADLWPNSCLIQEIQKLGSTHEDRTVDEVTYDQKNQIYSTPGYMYQGAYHEIDDGVGKMIKAMVIYMKHSKKR